MKKISMLLVVLTGLFGINAQADIPWQTLDSGGNTSQSSGFVALHSVGQSSAIGLSGSGNHRNAGGFYAHLRTTTSCTTAPAAAILTTPGGTITTATPTYTWNATPCATQYTFQLINVSGATLFQQTDEAATRCSNGVCSLSLTLTLTPGNYTWRVQTANAFGTGPWSERTFAYTPLSSSNGWWEGLNIFAFSVIPLAIEHIVNVLGWGMVLERDAELDWYRVWVESIQTKGGYFVGSISTDDATHVTHQEHPELESAAILDIDKNRLIVDGENLWQNTNEPLWQNFLHDAARRLVDAGSDGILIDVMEGTAASIGNGGSFGPKDMEGFRQYLAETYSTQFLQDQFGITDIQTFDYGVYIKSNSTWYDDKWKEGRYWEVPLFNDFLAYQRHAIVAFMTRLINDARDYAQTTYGRQLVFTANLFGLNPNYTIFADLLDYYTVEYPYLENGYPPHSQTIPIYKLARALGNKPAVLTQSIATAGNLDTLAASNTLMKLYVAEAYAAQGSMMTPYEIPGQDPDGGLEASVIFYSADMDVVGTSYRFIHNNPFLYVQAASQAQTAVVYSFPTALADWRHHNSYKGTSYALLDGQVQFDVLAMGDDYWLADTFSEEKLTPYKLLFLPGTTCLSNQQFDLLVQFMDQGGSIVGWGDNGSNDELNRPALNREITALINHPGFHFLELEPELGNDPGVVYKESHNVNVRQALTAKVSSPITALTGAPRTLNVLSYEGRDGTQLVTHLINYDYDINTDQVTPTGTFDLMITPSKTVLSQPNLQAYIMSPDRTEPLLLPLMSGTGTLSVIHGGVTVYDVLYILSEGDALALAQEHLASFYAKLDQVIRDGFNVSSLDGLHARIYTALTDKNYLLVRQLAMKGLEDLMTLSRPKILFDEAHDERNSLSWDRAKVLNPSYPEWASFQELAAKLADEFTFERNEADLLHTALLQNYAAVILAAPQQNFTSAELLALHQYIANGGGVIALGDVGIAATLNPFLAAYGMQFEPDVVFQPLAPGQLYIGNYALRNFTAHPAVQGITSFMTDWPNSLQVTPPAITLVLTLATAWQDGGDQSPDEMEPRGPFAMMAAYDVTGVRVAAVADNAFCDSCLRWNANDYVMRSLLRWGVCSGAVPAAMLIGPAGDITAQQATYRWNAERCATRYQLRVTGPVGTLVDAWHEAAAICSNGICAVPSATVLPLGTYTWQVRGDNTYSEGAWSSPMTFRVQSVVPNAPDMLIRQGTFEILTNTGSYNFSGANQTVSFTIYNLGAANLTLTGSPRVSIAGANAADFTVAQQPASPVLPAGSTTFTIRFAPQVKGTRTAIVSIANNAGDSNPYTFTIAGTGQVQGANSYLLWTK